MRRLAVSDLDERLETELKSRAERHGCGSTFGGPPVRTSEEEVRQILADALLQPREEEGRHEVGLGSRIAALFAGVGLTADIPEWKGEKIEPMRFDEGG